MTLYRCNVCNVFEYNPNRGDSVTGINPGTDPEDFPDYVDVAAHGPLQIQTYVDFGYLKVKID